MKKLSIYLILLVLLSVIVLAAPGDPTCFVGSNTSVKTACVGGNAGIGNFSGNVTAQNGFLNINWSFLQSIPDYVKDWSSTIVAYIGNTTAANANYSQYVNISNAQALNDTALINAVNTTANIISLGACTINGTNCNKYNESARVDSLNLTKANLAGGNSFTGMQNFQDANFTGVVWFITMNSTNVTGYTAAVAFIENGTYLENKYYKRVVNLTISGNGSISDLKFLSGNFTITDGSDWVVLFDQSDNALFRKPIRIIGGGSFDKFKYLLRDYNSTSTAVYTLIPELTMPVDIGYNFIECTIFSDSTATTNGIQSRINVTGTGTQVISIAIAQNSPFSYNAYGGTTSSLVSSPLNSPGTILQAQKIDIFANRTTTGNMTFELITEVGSGAAVYVRAGSSCRRNFVYT